MDRVARRSLVGVASRFAGKLRAKRPGHAPECRARPLSSRKSLPNLGRGAQPRAHTRTKASPALSSRARSSRSRRSGIAWALLPNSWRSSDPQVADLAVSSRPNLKMTALASGSTHEARHVHLPPVRPRADRDCLARRDLGAADRAPQAYRFTRSTRMSRPIARSSMRPGVSPADFKHARGPRKIPIHDQARPARKLSRSGCLRYPARRLHAFTPHPVRRASRRWSAIRAAISTPGRIWSRARSAPPAAGPE